MMTPEMTVHFIDDFVQANTAYLNNLTLARLEFLSLWLQSHPDTSRMDPRDREDLCSTLQNLSGSPFFLDNVSTTWQQIASTVEQERKNGNT